jgi:hypothetical protein
MLGCGSDSLAARPQVKGGDAREENLTTLAT